MVDDSESVRDDGLACDQRSEVLRDMGSDCQY